jgi:voltage-gated potassium channel Kch
MPSTSVAAAQRLRLERRTARLFERIAHHPLRHAAYAVLTGLLVGGTIFAAVEEDTSIVDGVWWAFVSMTTVGYGDIAPKSAGIRMLATFVIATGIAATAILTAALAGRVAEARLSERERTVDLDDDFDDLVARLQVLKERYVHDERHDDMLTRRAVRAVDAWQSGDATDEHLEELAKCLAAHPELREQR